MQRPGKRQLAFCGLLMLAACGSRAASPSTGSAGSAGSDGSAGLSGRVPMQHRAEAAACSASRPPGTCALDGGLGALCTTDNECSDGGMNGRCNSAFLSGIIGCACSSDACLSDSDCQATNSACACDESRGNRCARGNCRVDADCGPGGYCSPTVGDCGLIVGIAAYYCHGPRDKCIDDADCPSRPGGDTQICFYSEATAAWTCGLPGCPG
jgi:hypothetical protein